MAKKAVASGNNSVKKGCLVTREQFEEKAPGHVGVEFSFDGTRSGLPAHKKVFSTGSLGYYGTGKIMLTIDGKPVQAQVGVTITLIGSKELAQT